MITDLVTIGIPVYNGERFIEMAVKSVLNQTFKNFELIISDDGSTDRTCEIIKKFKDDRITIISDDKNRGIAYRLNQQISISKGKYFARMDADDVMFPDRIKIQVDEFERHNIDVLYSDAISINSYGNVVGYKLSKQMNSRRDILDGIVPIHPTVMARTSFLRSNPYKEEYAQMEDFELWYRLIDRCIFKNINTPTMFYREDSSPNSRKHKNMTQSKKKFANEYNFSRMSQHNFVFLSWFRYFIYKLLEMVNMDDVLLKRRYSALSNSDIRKYQEILNLSNN